MVLMMHNFIQSAKPFDVATCMHSTGTDPPPQATLLVYYAVDDARRIVYVTEIRPIEGGPANPGS